MVRHNLEILALMNRLTTTLEHDSVRRTRDLRLIQTGAFILALANFLLIVFGMLRRYRSIEEDSKRWQAMARHDPLTGDCQPQGVRGRRWHSSDRARIDAQPGALLMLDLDGFKGINDRFGHAIGDDILRAVATRLEAAARATDVVARLGGDEFAILCPLLHGRDDVNQLCERLITHVLDLPRDDIPGCRLGISIGVALYPEDGYNPATSADSWPTGPCTQQNAAAATAGRLPEQISRPPHHSLLSVAGSCDQICCSRRIFHSPPSRTHSSCLRAASL
jgi:diguanylate cyclase (GGDEF)-like protein